MDIDLALQEQLPQTFNSQDVEDIKSAIDVPRANVTILNTVYSPEETKIGVWREYRTVEGQQVLMEKSLYLKVVDFGALPNATNKTIQHGIANIDRIVELSGNASNGTSTYQLPRAYYTTSYIIDLSAPTKAEISIITNVDYSAFNGTIFMQYTKTTDEWEVVE